eukprot:252013_1
MASRKRRFATIISPDEIEQDVNRNVKKKRRIDDEYDSENEGFGGMGMPNMNNMMGGGMGGMMGGMCNKNINKMKMVGGMGGMGMGGMGGGMQMGGMGGGMQDKEKEQMICGIAMQEKDEMRQREQCKRMKKKIQKTHENKKADTEESTIKKLKTIIQKTQLPSYGKHIQKLQDILDGLMDVYEETQVDFDPQNVCELFESLTADGGSKLLNWYN